MSALSVALLYKVNYEQSLQSTDTSNNLAFYGAEAGMENMMAGLNSLYHLQASPLCSDVNGLTTTANQPQQSDVGVTYPTYQITLSDTAHTPMTACVTPPSQVQSITQGANAGLQAQVVPLTMTVGALRPTGEAVSMIRQVEVARIPIFQFGVFSESDLSFFPGPDFDFNGRVHTNRNLFLAATGTVTFHSQIRAAGDVVRDQLANGQGTIAQGRTGSIKIPTTGGGCDGAALNCRNLAMTGSLNEGSSVGGPTPTYGGTGTKNLGSGSSPVPWTTISTNGSPYYGSMILSGTTGATKLQMAFVKDKVDPIEIIRRPAPPAIEPTGSSVYQSRLYTQAQIRVLLSDDPADLSAAGATDSQNIRLANYANQGGGPDYTTGVAVDGSVNHTYFAEGTTAAVHDTNTNTDITDPNWVSPPSPFNANNLLARPNPDVNAPIKGGGPTWNLMDGYIRVEYMDKTSGAYIPVTREWLELGFARGMTPPTTLGSNPVHPHAILIFQELANRNGNAGIDGSSSSPWSSDLTSCSSSPPSSAPSYTQPYGATACSTNKVGTSAGGTCTSSKKKWVATCTVNTTPELVTDTGTGSTMTGAATRNNWYPINMYDTREGEFRDINSGACKVNGVLNVTEIDVANLRAWLKGNIGTSGQNVDYKTQNGYILYFSDRRGMLVNTTPGVNRKNGEYGFEDVLNSSNNNGVPDGILDVGEDVNGNNSPDTWGKANLGLGFGRLNVPSTGVTIATPQQPVSCSIGRANWVSGARHAVRLVDGGQGNIPTRLDANAEGGFTLASENPAYVLGDYNAAGGFGDPHASASVIADTVTLLSNGWSDQNMFNNPTNQGNRPASDTWYRLAIATGKNINFPVAPYIGMPGVTGSNPDYGTDGGVHNFLRFLENWGSKNIYYKGSMASMYYSQYATGVFKCCASVYGAPTRNYSFDLDFNDLSNMPPGTPTVTDVVNLGFQQIF
ncbi:MAG TPA: hypothetical protein VLK33_16310 [Terriglobales bacterium]|nr:hypothetical protein [Terriglobales bacterium]